MPRRAKVIKRAIIPDAKYQSTLVATFINRLMMQGKKSVAERIIYDALQIIQERTKENPMPVLEQALKNACPLLEVKPRRVGGATYQVPVEVRADRSSALGQRWLINAARDRQGKSMAEKLAAELMDAAHGQGVTIKKREDTHKMAEANRAFAHYRW
jgi:small subunit ribosomal protein S7